MNYWDSVLNISIQEVVYLNFKRRLNKLEYSGIRFTWDILVKRLNNFLTFLSLILWNDHQTNPVIVTPVHVD